ncbi:hypothetical protein FRACA_150018 [Frankia canadensis]|uniref:Uncharacterized protein n=1 Tax=Frankia canadensis TaxID=1836972 RepID=A0A2I2KLX6_9ACTN|nr:hypothetical protein FRACA_150018 [Frankia canadensis]SOU53936.1 hypothetical protein FRACA_150018 [Frankia canadensis]
MGGAVRLRSPGRLLREGSHVEDDNPELVTPTRRSHPAPVRLYRCVMDPTLVPARYRATAGGTRGTV